MSRSSALVEKLGIPTVTVLCSGFALQGRLTAKALEMENLPFALHPGQVNFVSDEQLEKNCVGAMLDQLVHGLTVQPADRQGDDEPGPKDVVFEGAFEEVQEHFLRNEWSEGLPIVPPTVEKVERFLQFTDRAPDEVIGVLLPDSREATVWNVAVNGLMSGCRPEYMPVLLGLVDAMVDPAFGQEHLGHTPGTETLIILNGPIIRQLGFNYLQGALRPGFQANTSIGRFWRMYMRNVAGFLPHKTDKGCYGGNFRVVLAENEDACAEFGWEPLSVDQGFAAGENVVTITSCTELSQAIEVGGPTAEEILRNIESRLVDNQLFIQFFLLGRKTRPTVILTPAIVEALSREGWTKAKVKQHFYENAKLWLARLGMPSIRRFYKGIEEGAWPMQLGTTKDLDRYIQMVSSPDDFMIAIGGDPARDHVAICAENGYIGYPVSKKIFLPPNWEDLLKGLSASSG